MRNKKMMKTVAFMLAACMSVAPAYAGTSSSSGNSWSYGTNAGFSRNVSVGMSSSSSGSWSTSSSHSDGNGAGSAGGWNSSISTGSSTSSSSSAGWSTSSSHSDGNGVGRSEGWSSSVSTGGSTNSSSSAGWSTSSSYIDENGVGHSVGVSSSVSTGNSSGGISATAGSSHSTGTPIFDASKIKSIRLNRRTAFVTLPGAIKLSVAGVPASAVQWTSSKPGIAKVDANGKVTGIAKGKTIVTARLKGKPSVSARCSVSVKIRPVKSLRLSKTQAKMNRGKTLKLAAKIAPTNASIKTVNWKSSNKKIATVDGKGAVTAVSSGSVTITATTKDGSRKTAKCRITVTN